MAPTPSPAGPPASPDPASPVPAGALRIGAEPGDGRLVGIAVADPGPVELLRSPVLPHVGVLRGTDPGLARIRVGDGVARALLVVRLEEHGGLVVLRHPETGDYLYGRADGRTGAHALGWGGRADEIPAHFVPGAPAPHPPRVPALPRGDLGELAQAAHMRALLDLGDEAAVALFLDLLPLLDRTALVAMLPQLAGSDGYRHAFRALQRRLASGDGVFPLTTAGQFFDLAARFGWTIGAHTYGRPILIDESVGRLEIGRYCSLAAFATLVLGNHTTRTATTFPFAMLRDYWPQSLAGIGLVDHAGGAIRIGNDVWIGHNAVVLPGTTIGDGAVIGANCVVRGEVPPYAIMAGNPGRVVRHRFEPGIVARLRAIAWWDWPDEKVDRFIPLLLDPDIENFLRAAEADARVPPPARGTRLSGPASQSSLFPWSERASAAEDAAGLLCGALTGGYQNHTDLEDGPWWQVDLGAGARLCEVRVFNRLDPATARRADGLELRISEDGRRWRLLHAHRATEPFGGADGRPLRWRAEGPPVPARFLRAVVPGRTVLHLDQVEIFGAAPADP